MRSVANYMKTQIFNSFQHVRRFENGLDALSSPYIARKHKVDIFVRGLFASFGRIHAFRILRQIGYFLFIEAELAREVVLERLARNEQFVRRRVNFLRHLFVVLVYETALFDSARGR